MKIPWKVPEEGSPVPEEQYQERFWLRRLDGIGLDTVNKEVLAIEFKRTRGARSNYVEDSIAVAQEQYTSLLTGLQAVGQVKGWKAQQIVFVGGTCGSVHVESFNKNMKTLGILESKWDPILQKLVRCLLEEQDKVLRSYFAQKGGARSQRGEGIQGKGREHVKDIPYCTQQVETFPIVLNRLNLVHTIHAEIRGPLVRNITVHAGACGVPASSLVS